MPAAVAVDLDGTVLNSQSVITARNKDALLRALAAGIPLAIATSRPARVIDHLVGEEVADACSLVQMNGSLAEGRWPLEGLHKRPVCPDDAALTADIVESIAPDARMTVELDGWTFGVSHIVDALDLWSFTGATADTMISVSEALRCTPAKVSINGMGKDLSFLADEIRRQVSAATALVPNHNMTFINVVHQDATKQGALAALLEPAGVELGDVLAFGDDVPDLGLVSACGISVAVANAIPEIKYAARYETASNDDDGVALVLEKLMTALGR